MPGLDMKRLEELADKREVILIATGRLAKYKVSCFKFSVWQKMTAFGSGLLLLRSHACSNWKFEPTFSLIVVLIIQPEPSVNSICLTYSLRDNLGMNVMKVAWSSTSKPGGQCATWLSLTSPTLCRSSRHRGLTRALLGRVLCLMVSRVPCLRKSSGYLFLTLILLNLSDRESGVFVWSSTLEKAEATLRLTWWPERPCWMRWPWSKTSTCLATILRVWRFTPCGFYVWRSWNWSGVRRCGLWWSLWPAPLLAP